MTNRVVYGPLPGGGFGLRVSRPGHDVLNTGLSDNQLAFDSRWPAAMRIVMSGVGTGGTINYPYPLGQVPFVIGVEWLPARSEYTVRGLTASATGFVAPAGWAYYVGIL